ncbi:MAG TPA: hypothetical protein VFK16_06490 [Gemmatimonadaceae bacterium]|nr:hypothetical protein [Gemmatimonadaceae bacterium]
MTSYITGLRLIIRIAFALLLLLGFYMWIMGAEYLRSVHMGLGFVFVILLLVLAVAGALSGGGIKLAAVTVLWAIVIPVIGVAQLTLLPGELHWVIRVIHLLVGIGAMPFAERLARNILEHDAKAGKPA